MHSPLESPTIAARLTAEIPAAIATIAVRGPNALAYIARYTRLSSAQLKIGRVRYANWAIISESRKLEEQVVVCRTEDQMLEVHCHGGNAVCQAILRDLASAGCQIVPQRQWPSRLTCPLAQAAEQDILATSTDKAAALMLDQISGALSRSIAEILDQITAGNALAASAGLQSLLHWSEFGAHLAHPWKIVLAGPPNVGKSSLINAIIGQDRVIVHHEPGTTRDWIECPTAIEGWPVAFTDTAGVREARDTVEQQGVQRSYSRLRQADLAVFVVDARVGWTDAHDRLLAESPNRRLIAWNKCDVADGKAASVGPHARLPTVFTSAVGVPNVHALLDAICGLLIPEVPPPGAAIPFRPEQVSRLQHSLTLVQASRQREAAEALRELLPSWNG